MSFLTKYQQYGLNDDNLLGWYLFSDLTDGGPNSNDLNDIGSPISVSSPPAIFNGNVLELPCGDQTSFSAFIALNKLSNDEASVIISNYDSSGYYFGYTSNFDFFVYAKEGGKSFIKFYKNIRPSNTCILVFSRNNNNFSLSSYSPLTNSLETESIYVPDEINLGSGTTKIGLGSLSSPFEATSKYSIYELSFINVSVPNFVLTGLCNELFESSSFSDEQFKFSYTSVKDKSSSFYFQQAVGNTDKNTGILLAFSPIVSGFPLLKNDANPSGTFYRNNSTSVPSVFSNYVQFTGQSENDVVVWDNFASGLYTGSLTLFSGSIYAKAIRDKPIIFKNTTRQTKNFVSLDSGNLCYGKNIIFENKSNLTII